MNINVLTQNWKAKVQVLSSIELPRIIPFQLSFKPPLGFSSMTTNESSHHNWWPRRRVLRRPHVWPWKGSRSFSSLSLSLYYGKKNAITTFLPNRNVPLVLVPNSYYGSWPLRWSCSRLKENIIISACLGLTFYWGSTRVLGEIDVTLRHLVCDEVRLGQQFCRSKEETIVSFGDPLVLIVILYPMV